MIPIIICLFIAIAMIPVVVVIGNKKIETIKANWAADTRKWEEREKILKTKCEELQASESHFHSECEKFKKANEEDAKREEENAKAFEDTQALLKEAEDTNEVLLKCITGELSKADAIAQLGEIKKTSVIQETELVAG